jgi:hypothetical protein
MLILDHIAVVCDDLADGVAWVEERLGVVMQPGGQHAHFGTYNQLLGLGPDLYLEVIARDPGAAHTDRPAWFGLDAPIGAPRLGNWICQSDDLGQAPEITGLPVALSRGDLRWQLTVPDDGSLPMQGGFPTLIKWAQGVTPPAATLQDRGVRLKSWTVYHPEADDLRARLGIPDTRISFAPGEPGFEAEFDTPDGVCRL